MSIPIRPTGRFFKVDANGYLVNDASWTYIALKDQEVLDEIVKVYRKKLNTDLHSIYLRGTLARGLFCEDVSDVDTFALVHQPNIRWSKPDWAAIASQRLVEQFPNLSTIEMMLSSYDSHLQTTYPSLAMQIKTQSLCLYGEDIGSKIKPYKIGREIMINHQWLAADLAECMASEILDPQAVRQLMKTILRSGLELVMERAQRYSPDLYLCSQLFAKYYPTKASLMEQTLYYYLNPNVKKNDLAAICTDLIPELQAEINLRLN